MTDFFHWKWMWQSRRRVIGIGLGGVLIGLLLIGFMVLSWPRMSRSQMLVIWGGVFLVGSGGYQVLQGLFSPAAAFGIQESVSDEEHRVARMRKFRRPPPKPEPPPLRDELS